MYTHIDSQRNQWLENMKPQHISKCAKITSTVVALKIPKQYGTLKVLNEFSIHYMGRRLKSCSCMFIAMPNDSPSNNNTLMPLLNFFSHFPKLLSSPVTTLCPHPDQKPHKPWSSSIHLTFHCHFVF